MDDDPRSAVPALRISRCNRADVRPDGQYVLYWMSAARRTQHSFALDRALDWAEHLITLNDRYALDGRDPSSYNGIAWVLGRYDRPWGPERPIFGKVRYMTSASARRKLQLKRYLERHGGR